MRHMRACHVRQMFTHVCCEAASSGPDAPGLQACCLCSSGWGQPDMSVRALLHYHKWYYVQLPGMVMTVWVLLLGVVWVLLLCHVFVWAGIFCVGLVASVVGHTVTEARQTCHPLQSPNPHAQLPVVALHLNLLHTMLDMSFNNRQ